MTFTLKRYTVTVTAWSAYRVEIDAADEGQAAEIAEELYQEDLERFDHRDGGISDTHVVEHAPN